MAKRLTLVGFAILGLLSTGCSRRETTLKVTIEYPATPKVIEDAIAAPVEQQIAGVEGLLSTTSVSGAGRYDLYVQSRPGVDAATFATLVKNRLQLAVPVLPHRAKVGNVEDMSGKPIPPLPEIHEVYSNYTDIDRTKAARLGISMQTASDEVHKALKSSSPLDDVTIASADGKKVRLGDFAKIRTVHEPNYRVHRFPPADK